MTLYLKLNSPPADSDDRHLQAEISKEQWLQLQNTALPWQVSFDPAQILLLRE